MNSTICHGHSIDRSSAVKHLCTELCTDNECCFPKVTVVSVSKFDGREAVSLVFGAASMSFPGGTKVVADVNGDTMHFSKIDGSETWRFDAHFRSNGFPVFCHGAGSIMSRPVADSIAAQLAEVA